MIIFKIHLRCFKNWLFRLLFWFRLMLIISDGRLGRFKKLEIYTVFRDSTHFISISLFIIQWLIHQKFIIAIEMSPSIISIQITLFLVDLLVIIDYFYFFQGIDFISTMHIHRQIVYLSDRLFGPYIYWFLQLISF